MKMKFRHCVQIVVFLAIILVTYFNHYENQKIKYGGAAIIRTSPVLSVIDKIVGRLDKRTEIMTFVQGDVWAARIGKLRITDPLALLGNVCRTKKIYISLLLSSLIPIILTLGFGKIFCRWICPMGFLFEINNQVRKFLKKMGVPLVEGKIPVGCKYIVLGVGLVLGLLTGTHYFFIIYPPKLVSGEIYFMVTRAAFSMGIFFILTYLIVELFLAPRVWCRSLCPGGAVYTLLNRWGRRKVTHKKVKQILFFLIILFAAVSAQAHHIRGLPHYGYSKNYPQIPTYEEIRRSADWEITFTFIKIFETNNYDLAVYLKNIKTGIPFNGPVNFKVFAQWEDPSKMNAFDAQLDPTNTYRVGWVTDKDGIYTLRIQFSDAGKRYSEDFKMQIGKVKINPLWFIIPGGVVFLLVLIIAIKRKRSL